VDEIVKIMNCLERDNVDNDSDVANSVVLQLVRWFYIRGVAHLQCSGALEGATG
jgi:hypothetical protein